MTTATNASSGVSNSRPSRSTDLIGEQTYGLADGTEAKSMTFFIRSLKGGNTVVQNVKAGVVSTKGSLLLGQSFLERFKSWSIDNTKHVLLLD
jgi:predicted aspartyl protease